MKSNCKFCQYFVNNKCTKGRLQNGESNMTDCFMFRDCRDKLNLGTRDKESLVYRLEGTWMNR